MEERREGRMVVEWVGVGSEAADVGGVDWEAVVMDLDVVVWEVEENWARAVSVTGVAQAEEAAMEVAAKVLWGGLMGGDWELQHR
mmetsp:Transcript_42837/g.80239  ORF Transcript_42837/g.80239 Transcript_42837/m.80239 type:complete len:85 (+) Transcript_42837:1483-1737(+)